MPTSPTGASALTHSFWMGNLWAPTSGQLPPSFHFGTAVGGGRCCFRVSLCFHIHCRFGLCLRF